MQNQEQIDFWNGPRAAQWVAGQELLDRQLAPFGEAALAAARLAPGEQVIDIGCGCGDTTIAIARAVGVEGSVLGVDVSRPMLARARERTAGLQQVRLTCQDASTVDFDAKADCVFSRFGVMFFDDPHAAFENLRRALVPGGRLAFVCWRALTENEWMAVPLKAVSELVPGKPPVPPDAPGPYAFADPARVHRVLEGAGFRSVQLVPIDELVPLGTGGLASAAAEAVTLGPAARLLLDADEATRARAEAAVRAALAPHARGEDVRLHAAVWVVTATAS